MREPVRVLHVMGNTQLGGAESRVMDLYRHMDRSRVQFDFLVHTDRKGYFDEEIQRLGGRIFRVPRFRLYNYPAYCRAVKRFFREHSEFKAVQGHITSTAAIYLPIAKRAGIPVTAAHARSAGVDQGVKGILTRWMRRNLPKRADYLFTCSNIAGISVFGRKAVEAGRTIFIPNAIDTELFDFDGMRRRRIREELGIPEAGIPGAGIPEACIPGNIDPVNDVSGSGTPGGEKYVIGHVGRFHYAKNHEYLLQVFAALCREDSSRDYILLLLGEGENMDSARELAKQLGVQEKVLFLGNKGNACDYYQAMDYFVYPSRFEGLPGTVVEAQTAGLRCLISDSICQEVTITELVQTMSIQEQASCWASYIRKTAEYERRGYAREVRKAGFDVRDQAERMMAFYETGKWK